jgi:hypothetical protein
MERRPRPQEVVRMNRDTLYSIGVSRADVAPCA